MATPNNNNGSDEDKIDPMKDLRAGIIREVGSQAIWSLSSCKPGKLTITKCKTINKIRFTFIVIIIKIRTNVVYSY